MGYSAILLSVFFLILLRYMKNLEHYKDLLLEEKANLEEELKGREYALTQFTRAMEEDLEIKVINAGSPQAKGRVERLFGTLQDRLVKELRLAGVSSIPAANRFLDNIYLLIHVY